MNSTRCSSAAIHWDVRLGEGLRPHRAKPGPLGDNNNKGVEGSNVCKVVAEGGGRKFNVREFPKGP